ncbi:MAG: DUF362 domain-containing protein [Candidatus Hydrogenedentota bacterium]|nr:MAG: DUF362 domain-containing protein [Candidatus Hydrogenedentota bacterium]
MKRMSKVLLLQCAEYDDVTESVAQIFRFFDWAKSPLERSADRDHSSDLAAKNGNGRKSSAGPVLLKPNLLKATRAEEAVVTHPALVNAVRSRIEGFSNEILIGDSPGWGRAEAVAKTAGYSVEKPRVKIVDFRRGSFLERKRPRRGPRGIFLAREALEASVIFDLPKLKGHVQMGFTGAVKNLFGCVVGKRKPLYHCLVSNSKKAFAHLLLDIVEALPPVRVVMDGIVLMEGDGPSAGRPRHGGFLLAGEDPLSVDIVAAKILGFAPDEVPLLAAAKERGYPWRISDIETEGAAIEEIRLRDFVRPRNIDITFNPFRLAWSVIKGQWYRYASVQ